ncbi:Formate/glycerate dehydrogenase catalytic domain-like protein [Terfezia boudieri ATCC MYA-4762]|uniref:Formate/glycerate dehydrogenase catalytic domain-like protein n=1 Tax=Terfezia boudieri ATCC MYA-4762 TaxID=1051890 RepID=A0A3N4M069_9PEZI|nr:Formate/glycerate dehydrogenase catalytic domain-like protein [Terfezia boudieri ATCC MYA-4762]
MTEPREIIGGPRQATANYLSISTSPISTSILPYAHMRTGEQLKPLATEDIKILLLENINKTARDIPDKQGYQMEFLKGLLSEDKLIEKISECRDIHAIEEAKNLLAVGCFCIGINQVDLEYARKHGIVVLNSPFSNSRSVAELMLAEIITLARQLGGRNEELYRREWNKVSNKCWEIRRKALVSTLTELLSMADFVTWHVPKLLETKNMIGKVQFLEMKHICRRIPALFEHMTAGRIAGAALDAYSNEPAENGPHNFDRLNTWVKDLRGLTNLILTPHIEVLTRYINEGSPIGSVNMPKVTLRSIGQSQEDHVRIIFIHQASDQSIPS